jgi:hypothetical protein
MVGESAGIVYAGNLARKNNQYVWMWYLDHNKIHAIEQSGFHAEI